jgi:hypothetical protein
VLRLDVEDMQILSPPGLLILTKISEDELVRLLVPRIRERLAKEDGGV